MNTDSDIDEHIKNFWKKFGETEELIKEFINPSKENSVNCAFFFSFLDLGDIEQVLNKAYKKQPVYPKKAMLKAVFLMMPKRLTKITELYRYLKANREDAILLGFEVKNKEVKLPSYETFRDFIKNRLGEEGMNALFMELVKQVKEKIEKNNCVSFGETIIDDATPHESARKDKETEFSAYYKKKGEKTDIVIDEETQLPIAKETIGISEDEGKCLKKNIKKLKTIGINPKKITVDGKYSSYENIAFCGVNGIEMNYAINRAWNYNEKGTLKEIKRIYHKFWKEEDFILTNDEKVMLSYLERKGRYEEVGSFFRNEEMAKYEEAPDCYLEEYHVRNRIEGFNGNCKWLNHLEEFTKGKRRILARIFVSLFLSCILAVALTRLQNGIRKKLGSIVYLT